MKNFIKLLLSFIVYSFLAIQTVLAAGIDHFEVHFSPESAEIGEAIDLTIEAVDKNNTIITDYEGTILIFSESDPEAELPSALEENTYTYVPSDEGIIKFENAVKFKNAGNQNIHIYDLNDDTVFGIAEASITEAEVIENIDIEILSPTNGLTIGENTIGISGTTKKNHKVKIIVNNQKEFETTSNEEGIFEVMLEGLSDGENIIKAQILDSNLHIIGESKSVNIKVDISNLNIKNIKVTPEIVYPENSFKIEVITNPGLESIQIILDDLLTSLKEVDKGVYSAEVYAPNKIGTFKIDIKMSDELGHKKTILGSSSITVKEIEYNSAQNNISKNNGKIKGLKLVELKSKSILTWDPIKGVKSYNIYKKTNNGKLELVTNVTKTKYEIAMIGNEIKYDYFAVKPVSETATGEIYEGSLSDATKIQTGPEILILFIISFFIGGLVLIINRKNA